MNNEQIRKNLTDALIALTNERDRLQGIISRLEEARDLLNELVGTKPTKKTKPRPPWQPEKATRNWSPEQRAKAAERMRKMWAKKKREARKAAKEGK